MIIRYQDRENEDLPGVLNFDQIVFLQVSRVTTTRFFETLGPYCVDVITGRARASIFYGTGKECTRVLDEIADAYTAGRLHFDIADVEFE